MKLSLNSFFLFFLLAALLMERESVAQNSTFMLPQARSWQHEVIQETIDLFTPLSKEKRFRLKIDILPYEAIAASAAHLGDGDLRVHIGQGLLDSPRLSPDILRIVLCHEIGHLLGGKPRLPVPPEWRGARDENGKSLLTSEGQADYYSTVTCFRKLAKSPDSLAFLTYSTQFHNPAHRQAPPRVQKLCRKNWTEVVDQLICERASMAAFGFLNLVTDFPISLSRKDHRIVSSTITNSYPARQCRLDTMVAGALCAANLPLDLTTLSDLEQSCDSQESNRPQCWFQHQ